METASDVCGHSCLLWIAKGYLGKAGRVQYLEAFRGMRNFLLTETLETIGTTNR
jgi:hypothetical protein